MSRPHTRARVLAVFLAIAALVAVVVTPGAKAEAALSGSQFNAANIISDSAFFNASAMTQAQIQSFLAEMEPTCTSTSCLKTYKQTTTTVKADAYGHCKTYTGASSEPAAAIIYKVQQACGISARVLLVTLQKEQGLVTSKAPTTSMLDRAMGFACPDTPAGCNAKYYGFFNQVFHAAYQFQVYVTNPNSFSYAAGRTSRIQYNPATSCGSATVTIANKATAALYNYTPYVPNKAALANLYGVGDSCSAYGNRNFWRFYNEWFGSGNSPFGVFDSVTVSGGTATVAGWAIDPVEPTVSLTVQVAVTNPSGATATTTATASVNRPDLAGLYGYSSVGSTTPHGFSVKIPKTANGSYRFCVTARPAAGNSAPATSLGCKSLMVTASGVAATVTRLQGAQRWDTAAAISKRAFPDPGVPVAYIASGETFPDGLSAAPAAAKQGGPVLFVQKNSVPSATMSELKRLKPSRIVIVGGTSAVSSGVYNTLRTVQKSVARIGGATRYQTAQLIAKSVFPTASTVFVATGTDYPDALSAGAAAGALGAPVLLVDGSLNTNDGTLTAQVKAMTAKKIYIAGGADAVSSNSVRGLSSIGASVTRLSGTDRYDTSTKIANAVFTTAPAVYFASGATYPDALAGAVLAGRTKSPLLVTRTSCVPGSEQQTTLRVGATSITVLGGTAALGSGIDTMTVCR